MRRFVTTVITLFTLSACGLTASAQPQPDKPGERPGQSDAQTRRRDGRGDDDAPPPPPGKGRPKADGGDKRGPYHDPGFGPRPVGVPPQGMAPGSMPGSAFGGFGVGGMGGGMVMPGRPGPFEQHPDDAEMREILRQDMELEHKTHEFSMRIRESRGEERTKLKAELGELVNKHFDVRQKRRELQLKRMEDELQRLREAISSRNKSRESIVTNHIKELIGEERDLEF
jgi:hypothetical protein